MNKRVYGIIGIKSIMSNWNADFTGRPKTLSNGDIFGSDKACKYPMRKYWVDNGEKVVYYKSYKIEKKGEEKEKIQPKELQERYDEVFYPDALTEKTSSKEVLKNLFSAVDVMNFGATFAVAKQNISITGVVQINQGLNKYEEAKIEVQDILSPFRNSQKNDADASSLGKKIVTDEAHYFYGFSVNPNNISNYNGLVDGFNGYTDEAYEKFKKAALVSATALNTNSKSGCENEFTMFVQLKEGNSMYLSDLSQYVKLEKSNDKINLNLDEMKILLEDKVKNDIEKIEIYYNPYTVAIHAPNLEEISCLAYYNIFTGEKIN